jgi:hypothetical protein
MRVRPEDDNDDDRGNYDPDAHASEQQDPSSALPATLLKSNPFELLATLIRDTLLFRGGHSPRI